MREVVVSNFLVQVLGRHGKWISLAGFIYARPVETMLREAHVAHGEKYRIVNRQSKTVASGIRI